MELDLDTTMTLSPKEDIKYAVQEALCLTDEEAESVLVYLDTIKTMIHDIKQADSDPTGANADEVVEKIIKYIV